MPQDFPELKDGDELEPWHLNVIFAELRRWRLMTGAGVSINGAEGDSDPSIFADDVAPFFIQLTGGYSSGYPWKEVLIGPTRAVTDGYATGSASDGDPAFELQSGDTTLAADGTVYQARRSRGSNLLVFDGKN